MRRITIAGCGFLGGLVAEEIVKRAYAAEEVLNISLVDPDTFEERNVANQMATLDDVGKPKAEVLLRRVAQYGKVSAAAVAFVGELQYADSKLLWVTQEGERLEFSTTVLVDCTDSLAARQAFHRWAVEQRGVCLHVGLSQAGLGSVEWSRASESTFSLVDAQPLQDELKRLPPCELVGLRGVGLLTAWLAAKALALACWDFNPDKERASKVPTYRISADLAITRII